MRRRYAIGIILYHDYNWTVRGDLDPALVKEITQAFLKLDPTNPADKELLELQRATRYTPTEPAYYEGSTPQREPLGC
jgi:phosphonate transport system substrate-binding protein